ncbi:MAG: hypothetical protein R3A51_15950 [Nannocystaceae bacterium]|nr:hypothetical protein [Myxococcales bacterium]
MSEEALTAEVRRLARGAGRWAWVAGAVAAIDAVGWVIAAPRDVEAWALLVLIGGYAWLLGQAGHQLRSLARASEALHLERLAVTLSRVYLLRLAFVLAPLALFLALLLHPRAVLAPLVALLRP